MGRPSDFKQETVNIICERLADGESLRKICLDGAMPGLSTVMRWLADDQNVAFREQYARAREAQADKMADEILSIADTPVLGVTTKISEDGKVETTEGDMLQHRRLQVDARKWLASKMAPKKYGEKVQTEISGPDGKPIEHTHSVSSQTQNLLEQMRGKPDDTGASVSVPD